MGQLYDLQQGMELFIDALTEAIGKYVYPTLSSLTVVTST